MDWTKPPFRADHVGSLLRPKVLTSAFRSYHSGELADDEFIAIQDAAIRDVVELQESTGLKSITDGEFRRASYWARFVERVDGLEVREAVFKFHDDHGHEKDFTAPHVAAKVGRNQPIALDEYAFLRQVVKETAKVTLPSPPTMHFWRLNESISAGVYGDRKAYFQDLAKVFQAELAELAANGCSYVQLDEVPLAMLCDPTIRERVQDAGVEPGALIDDYVDLFNACLDGRPAGLTVAMHLCRGNFKSHYLSEGSYEEVAGRLFNDISVDGFFLEYDTSRAGDFQPLRRVPKDKKVILGLISTKSPEMETSDDLCARIEEAGAFIDMDQLGISPQCGFASTAGGNPVTEDDERAKLSLVVDVAKRMWSS